MFELKRLNRPELRILSWCLLYHGIRRLYFLCSLACSHTDSFQWKTETSVHMTNKNQYSIMSVNKLPSSLSLINPRHTYQPTTHSVMSLTPKQPNNSLNLIKNGTFWLQYLPNTNENTPKPWLYEHRYRSLLACWELLCEFIIVELLRPLPHHCSIHCIFLSRRDAPQRQLLAVSSHRTLYKA